MFERQIKTQPVLGSKNMNICDRANERDGVRSSSVLFSWYFAQRALPELKYVLTNKGYMVLS
jgi:hypothetical protein